MHRKSAATRWVEFMVNDLDAYKDNAEHSDIHSLVVRGVCFAIVTLVVLVWILCGMGGS